uniref:Uncharacterized protein n=1 Tax=Prymnesium polylepis TaxID=72548 RepID=A0A7S4KKY3_9EUKA
MATLKALTHAAKQTCMATGVHATHTDPCSISMHMQRRATAIAQALSISLSCSTHGRFAWVPIGTQAKRPCVEHDSEMLRACAIAVARRCMCMLMLHGSVWVACTPVAMHVCLAA